MAHLTSKPAYQHLSDRLNLFPQGAPPTELLFQILRMLFSEREAELVSLLPIKPFTAQVASNMWNMTEEESGKILNGLAERALLIDIERNGKVYYTLPPPMAGFFEFSMMRIRHDLDQKLLSELFYQYLNVEEDFIKALFTGGETQLGRVFVHEPVLSNDNALHVLDYERASAVIKHATYRGIGICYCRHKMQHLGRMCNGPLDICMTFNTTAKALVRHGYAREIDIAEGLDLLELAYSHNFVQFGENVKKRVSFICNCCGCCCEALIAHRRFGFMNPVHTTNFIPHIEVEKYKGCGKCVEACPVEALALVSANNPHKPQQKKARLDLKVCLGCGICARNCPQHAIYLKSRPEKVITPVDSTHRIVLMAIERGKLQNLVFDKQAFWSHRMMAAILGVILKLPPIKQVMANKQLKSKYLANLLAR